MPLNKTKSVNGLSFKISNYYMYTPVLSFNEDKGRFTYLVPD